MPRRKMISEIDNSLIDEIARLWVEGGGDKEGFYFCSDNIAGTIEDLLNDEESD